MSSNALSRIALSDGRRLSWAEYGDHNGKPLVVLHGTPGWCSQAQPMDDAARRAGVRIIAPERPGCGQSDGSTSLTFTSYVDDVRQLLDHLEISRAAVAGISGGGGFALACARKLSGRVSQAILIAALVPTPTPWRKHLMPSSRILFWMVRHLPRLAATLMRKTYPRDPEHPSLKQMAAQMPAADRRVIERADVRAMFFGQECRNFLEHGVPAAIHELSLYTRPLDFNLSEITVPVRIVHGSADRNVPLCVAEYLAAHIPSATLTIIPDAGHLFIVESAELLLDLVKAIPSTQ